MITKEIFKEVIKCIQEQDKFEEDVDKAFSLLNTSYTVTSLAEPLRKALEKILKCCFSCDVVDYIAWWLYDSSKKEIIIDEDSFTKEEIKKDVTNIDDFIDFIFFEESNLVDNKEGENR